MIGQAKSIWSGLEFRKPMMLRNVEPLSAHQMLWMPGPQRNCIAWQLWHIAEVEENWYGSVVMGEPPRLPFGVQVRQAQARQYPTNEQLLDYFHEVRALTRRRLEALAESDMARVIEDTDFGQLSVCDVWAGIVTSFAWHAGQIALTAKLLPDTPVLP